MYIFINKLFFITPANTAGARGDTSTVASLINQDRTTLSTSIWQPKEIIET